MSEYGDLLCKFPYSVQNTGKKFALETSPKYGKFSDSGQVLWLVSLNLCSCSHFEMFSYKSILFFNKQKTNRGFHQLCAASRTNKKKMFQYYQTPRKIIPLQQEKSVAKEKHQAF